MLKRGCGILRSKKGQTVVEYIVVAAALFGGLISLYVLYSRSVPQQFEQGAQIILKDYNAGK